MYEYVFYKGKKEVEKTSCWKQKKMQMRNTEE